MPIHDQGYRRYGGREDARGQAWLVIARAGMRTCFAKRVVPGPAARRLGAVLRPCRPALLCHELPPGSRFWRTLPQTFRDFLEFSRALRLLHHHLRRRRPHRQRPARQRTADLPLEAADARRVRRRQGRRAGGVPAARHLAAGHAAAGRAGAVRRQLRVRAGEPVSVSGDHGVRVAAGAHGDLRDAGALVALEEQPVRRRSCMPG